MSEFGLVSRSEEIIFNNHDASQISVLSKWTVLFFFSTFSSQMKVNIEPIPPPDLRGYVIAIYSCIANFSDEDYDVLTEYIRCLWIMRAEREQLTLKGLELIQLLKNRNQKIIFEEKQKLFAQLAELEALTSSSPFRDSAESV